MTRLHWSYAASSQKSIQETLLNSLISYHKMVKSQIELVHEVFRDASNIGYMSANPRVQCQTGKNAVELKKFGSLAGKTPSPDMVTLSLRLKTFDPC